MIQLQNLTKSFGDRVLLDSVTWQITDRERVGLCGANGAGKTTLLKVMAGLDEPDSGAILKPAALTVGYLPQDGLTHSGRALFEEAASAFGDLVAIKDEMPVAGQALTVGSRTYGPPAPEDSEVVRRLRAAGAIPIGITNVPELMMWPWTATVANGVTRNPWNPARTTGGSSGGSAAAVAAGMVPAATGSDGGGSIRIPAACCGLVGMKPSRGRVPGTSWVSMSVFGALARTVKDSALLLDVLARPSGEPPCGRSWTACRTATARSCRRCWAWRSGACCCAASRG